MTRADRGYFDPWREEVFSGSCGWRGTGAGMTPELFEALAQYDCPECGIAVLLVGIPTGDDVREAAAAGHAEAIKMLAQVEEGEARQARRAATQLDRPDQLPEIEGDGLVFDYLLAVKPEGSSSRLEYIVRLGDRDVWREDAGEAFEDWQRFFAIRDIFVAKYGERFERLIPMKDAIGWLAGDSFEGAEKLRAELPGKDEAAKPLCGPDGKPRAWWRKDD